MKVMRWMLVALLLSNVMPGIASRAWAQDVQIAEATAGADDSGVTADRWWGVFGAVICGVEIRLVSAGNPVGWNPWVLAAGIGGCALAALDAVTTH